MIILLERKTMSPCIGKKPARKESTKKISKMAYFIIGLLATIWVVLRVGTKPSRATYPCVRAAAPVASGYIMYLLGLIVSALALQKAKTKFKQTRYFTALVFALGGVFLTLHMFSLEEKPVFANTVQFDSSNDPIGTGQGLFPGRVIWAYNPDATNEKCTISWGDGYFLEKNSNISIIEEMVTGSILRLTGQSSVAEAWDSLFVYFNQQHNKGRVGYTEGEKIFIKINGVGTSSINANNELTRKKDYKMSRTSPQPVLIILRQLIHEYGILQENISVGDPMNYVIKEYFDLWYAEFPNVKYIDPRGTMGRTKAIKGDKPVIFYSDRGEILRTGDWSDASAGDSVYNDHLYTVLEEADYMINIAALKAHARAGVTLCAKSHFGSHTRIDAKHLHMGLVSPDNGNPTRSGYGKYRIQVDIMGHELLGGNTMLFMIDGLWGGSEAVDPPCKFRMEPFNNDWPSSIFMSQDEVALESVCLDFLKTEFTQDNSLGSWPQYDGTDDYLHQAADTSEWPQNFVYDPENDGTPLTSLGVHEHWNNPVDKEYSRNLGNDAGIELIKIMGSANKIEQKLATSSAETFELFHNYPNPFNPSTVISYQLAVGSQVELSIYNTLGEKVAVLVSERQQAGYHLIEWDAAGFASGVYVYRLHTGTEFLRSKKMILLR